MASDSLEATIAALHALRTDPPTVGMLRGQVNELAAQAAKATGASVRVVDVGGLTVRFSGRNAVAAGQLFNELAGARVVAWSEELASVVVGRLL